MSIKRWLTVIARMISEAESGFTTGAEFVADSGVVSHLGRRQPTSNSRVIEAKLSLHLPLVADCCVVL
jgi:hypothetical protein